MKRFFSTHSRLRGFTIVELVVAFIIIAILAAILVPTMISRAQQAKISAAQADLVHLGDAQERAGIDTGYLLRIYALDDVGRIGDNIAATDPDDVTESVLDNDVTANNPYVQPTRIFINAASENYTTNNPTLYEKLVAESAYSWNGPYLNFTRDVNGNDWPDDPWGNDYLFFTRAGVIFPPLSVNATGNDGDGSYEFQTTYRTVQTDAGPLTVTGVAFDRPTFLSMGPDGLPGDGTTAAGFGKGDDLVHQIGGVSGQTATTAP